MWISPSYQDADFPSPMSLDDKIKVFEDRTVGWKLDVADQVINGKIRPDGTKEREPIPHSGYAALDIVFSYFEVIGKYEAGYAQAGDSRRYFKEGGYSIFPGLRAARPPLGGAGVVGNIRNVVDEVLDIMYEGVRCGLYHTGITNGRVLLTGEVRHPLAFDPQNGILIINPHLLVPALKQHLGDYVARLRDVNNQDLRRNFERRFDYDTRP